MSPLSYCFTSLLVPSYHRASNLPALYQRVSTQASPPHRPSRLYPAVHSSTHLYQSVEGNKEGEIIEYDEIDLQKMKVAQLKDLCKAVGLPVSGKKNELIDRLLEIASNSQAGESTAPTTQTDIEPSNDGLDTDGGQDRSSTSSSSTVAVDGSYIDESATTNDMLVEGRYRLFTQPRTGNCWHGLYFDVEALPASGVTITGVRTASSPEYFGPLREDRLDVKLYVCTEGSAAGREKRPEAWQLIGSVKGVQLPTVAYGESEAFYGPLPLREPVHIPAGETRGFCVFTTSWRGVVLRAKLGSRFLPGDVTDEDGYVRLRAGLLPKNDQAFEDTMFTEVYSDHTADAFVGILEYNID